jgi:hypothetical protein
MRHARALLILIPWLAGTLPAQQPPFHFFDPAKVIDLQGTVQRIDYEDVYGKKSRFLVLTVLGGDQQLYRVEICPQWFFERDIAVGMKVQVHGSLIDRETGSPYLIAQQLSFQGERIALRDGRGFPLWSQRGAQDGTGRRAGRGRHGKR